MIELYHSHHEPIDGKMNPQELIGTAWCLGRYPFNGVAAFSFNNERMMKMNVKLFVGNLPKSMTHRELTALFVQAGDVIEADLITDRKNGESKGFAFVTMSSRSEAEKAIHMFNTYSLNELELKVAMAKSS